MEPILPPHELEAHALRLENAGFTFVPGALPPALLGRMQQRFDELIESYRTIPSGLLHPQTNAIDINQLLDVDPLFDDLIDMPSVFPIVQRALDEQVHLLGLPIANFTPPGALSRGGWHHDGAPYIRLTWFLSDITDAEGPTAVLPGSHRRNEAAPAWFNDADGNPREVPGMQRATGAAGTCMVNNTLIWHTGTPNTSSKPRRLVWVVFKHASCANQAPENLKVTDAFKARQVTAVRRGLCGLEE